ncbi:iron transporter biosynthesis regulating transcription factor, partial [Halteromyces radiatus]|uniref:iron transporter biosynthesis regulating transcription factor n=1 Tax=Halteromyces radiatus TaxID=101107 RepID=UPI002220F194
SCSHCGTDTTPLWRRAPNGDTICNACGLYLKTKHTMRPLSSISTIHPTKQKVESASGQCNGLGGSAACAGCPTFNNQHLRKQEQQTELMVCSNCRVSMTPLWRRDDQGNTICNACGLYYKLHKVHRPVSMKRNVIKRRKRV